MDKVYMRKRNRYKENVLDLEICVKFRGKKSTKKIGSVYENPSIVPGGWKHNDEQLRMGQHKVNLKVEELKKLKKLKIQSTKTGITDFTGFFEFYANKKGGQYLYSFKKYHEYTSYKRVSFLQINYEFMSDFYDYLIKYCGVSVNTANSYFNKFSGTVTEAVKREYLVNNPVLLMGLKRKKSQQTPKTRLNFTEFECFKDELPKNEKERLAKEMYLLSSISGFRISDLLNLEKRSVEVDESGDYYVSKSQNKTGDVINQYFVGEAKRILVSHLTESKSKYVFPYFRYSSDMNNSLRAIVSRLSINGRKVNKHLTLGSGRNTHGTLLYEKHNDIRLVKDSLGHKSYKYVDNYVMSSHKARLEKLKSTFEA